MQKVNYKKQLYLYDDRSKYDYVMKVSEILYEDNESILCKAVCWGTEEYNNQVEEEVLLIDKKAGEVRNSNFYSWLVTSDQKWITEQVEHLIEMYNE